MDSTEIENLLKGLENEENASLLELDMSIIKSQKNDILQRMQFSKDDLKTYHKKLSDYRYVDEVKDLRYGSFIRWFNISHTDDIKLSLGGILCDIKVVNDGIHLVCKNFRHKHIQIRMDECIIFQRLSDQERIILDVVGYLNK